MLNQYWYQVDFENIFYNPSTDNIVIPCGWGDGNENYIIITLNSSNSVSSISSISSQVEDYYNLNGQKIDPDQSKKEILIKRKGDKAEKVINN